VTSANKTSFAILKSKGDRFLDRTTRISLRMIPEGLSSCLPFSVIHASFFNSFSDHSLR
jgi:hypothetical protein